MINIYTDGTSAAQNPTWHEEDADFKVKYIDEILAKNAIKFRSVAEVGCGSGAVLKNLSRLVDNPSISWKGFDIANEPISMAKSDPMEGVEFHCQDLFETDDKFDILLSIDVFEHIPDYMGFLEHCREKARYKVYHIPLDLHVSAVLRGQLQKYSRFSRPSALLHS